MPYKSLAQEKYFNAHRKDMESQGVNVDEWNKESKGLKLPKKITKLKVKKTPSEAGCILVNTNL